MGVAGGGVGVSGNGVGVSGGGVGVSGSGVGVADNGVGVSGDDVGVETDAVQALNTARAKRPTANQYVERMGNLLIFSVHHNCDAERAPMPAFRQCGSRLCQ